MPYICVFEGCLARSRSNYLGEKEAKYCASHKLPGMINIEGCEDLSYLAANLRELSWTFFPPEDLSFSDISVILLSPPYTESEGYNPLHQMVMATTRYPCLNHHIRETLQDKTIVDIKGPLGYTPLMMASHTSIVHSSEETVRILLECGADPNMRTVKRL